MSFLAIGGKLQTLEVLLDIILVKCCTNVKFKQPGVQAEGAASKRNLTKKNSHFIQTTD